MDIHLPQNFRTIVFNSDVPNARSLALGAQGTVFVGTRTDGRVFALRDEDGDGRAERRYELASGLNMPNGVAFLDGDLYVAESGRILRFAHIEARLAAPPDPEPVAELPEYRHHGWRYLAVGPDGRLYVSMGAPCNVCEAEGLDTILSLRPDGSDRRVEARGVRSSVGMDWHPQSGELWFTDNGRDWLGDDSPADELNRLAEVGDHFGFPYCHAGDVSDPEFGVLHACSEFVPPARKLGAHVAPLGMRFYTGRQFPAEYRGQIFIAEHGSWNRSEPVGYRITLARLQGCRVVAYEAFAEGWRDQEGKVRGRPVDLLVMPDGSLLVSDDAAGRVYRIRYQVD